MIVTGYTILFAYVAIRAVKLSLVHDECLSHTMVLGIDYWRSTANHHVLNTFMMEVSAQIFGQSEWALRLPNVLSFLLYLLSCFLITRLIKHPKLQLFCAGFLVLHPFMLDFFSLARGYGISLGFMSMSLYFLLRRSIKPETFGEWITDYAWAIVMGALAILANLAMINYFIAMIGVFALTYLRLVQKKAIRKVWMHLAALVTFSFSFIPIILGGDRLLHLSREDELYIGEPNLLSSIQSFTDSILYVFNVPSWIPYVLQATVLILFALITISLLYKRVFSSRLATTTLVVYLIAIGLILENLIFSVNFPTPRTALPFIPLLSLCIIFFFEHLILYYEKRKTLILRLMTIVGASIMIHFVCSLNLSHTKTWHYDKYTKEVMSRIGQIAGQSSRPLTISNYWTLEPSINYYIITRELNVQLADRGGTRTSTDFIYDYDWGQLPKGFLPLLTFKDTGTRLLAKSHFVQNQ